MSDFVATQKVGEDSMIVVHELPGNSILIRGITKKGEGYGTTEISFSREAALALCSILDKFKKETERRKR